VPVPSLDDVVRQLHEWFPPQTADGWDAVGLVYGDPAATVKKVLFAVDPTLAVAEEAAEWGADLLVVHHPLFLKPVHGFAATTPKGRTLGTLVRADCALLTAHTNADQAEGGVSEALATALGLTDLEPIQSMVREAADKLTVFVPADAAAPVRAAIAEAGAGHIGNYDFASFTSPGQGRFRPLEGADPTVGSVGSLETVEEVRIEVVLDRPLRSAVVAAMLAAHPYEEPAYDVVELADPGVVRTGSGRIGTVERTTLGAFAETVAGALPETTQGVRYAGDPDRGVRRVAVCGGAGDFLLDTVLATDADVYVTSDLRHHPAGEFLEKNGPALIDVAHWAAEWTWLPVVEQRLRTTFNDERGDTVETRVSTINTDPWTNRFESTPKGDA
jgi:dinuclear metal center YbgI/SA1388 family protein